MYRIIYRHRLAALFLSVLALAHADGGFSPEFIAAERARNAVLAKDADYQVFDRSFTAPGEKPKATDSLGQLHWDFVALDHLLRAGDDYLAHHPDNPNRWRVVLRMTGVFTNQTSRLLTAADRAAVADVFDEKALVERAAMLAKLRAAALASTDLTTDDKLQLESVLLMRFNTASTRLKSKFGEWSAWRAELDRLAAAYPDKAVIAAHYDMFFRIRSYCDPTGTQTAIRAEWAKLTASPNHETAVLAAKRILVLDSEIARESGLQSAPLTLAFTAADGREVDLAKLRGKVVLMDFWATWCGPCVAELPNVKKVYAAYHDKGFEVIGIALENGKLQPTDTPEQAAAKLAKAKKVLTDFTAKNDMPWPQYFDGKWWKNDVSTKYGIGAIPAMFLLDRNGRVVTTNARGEKLELAVKQLLAATEPVAPAASPAATATAAVPVPDEADYAAFTALLKAPSPGAPKTIGWEKYLRWTDEQRQKVTSTGLAFYAAHPGDLRRWDVVLKLAALPPLFAKGFGPNVETAGASAAVIDEAAKAAWERKVEELGSALLASADAPLSAREVVEWSRFGRDFRATSAAKKAGGKFDYSGFRPRFDAHVAKYAQLDVVARRAADYLGALEENLPGTTLAIWRELVAAPNAALQAKAAERVEVLVRQSQPMDLAFTAADGRPVDLASLRGKVVLVDFWATWCGPCKAELPNVKKVYAAYRAKGFEVVGISLENAGLAPGDTPEQTTAKLAKARQTLLDFTTKNELLWPQYFDGKWWKNDVSTKYAIAAIPAMFLLDRDGRIVSTNARGEVLERDVKRLLKL